jgi:hypothetical protein
MRIGLIGPGIMPIPPDKWGAVEMLIWDYYKILTKHGYDVEIINTSDRNEIIKRVNNGNFDIVHLHYDVFIGIVDKFINTKVVVSSHYPFINNREIHRGSGYDHLFNRLVENKNFYIFASSHKDINTYIEGGADPSRVFLSRLGVKSDSYSYQSKNSFDKTLCFSQIVDRKRQYVIQNNPNIFFSGRLDDYKFTNRSNYLGELDRNILNESITKYGNFILISSVENTTPLSVKEAIVCGLGVVVSESVSVELDNMDFIDVVSESDIFNTKKLYDIIEYNRNKSIIRRDEIRDYGIKKFDVEEILISEYIPKMKLICRE